MNLNTKDNSSYMNGINTFKKSLQKIIEILGNNKISQEDIAKSLSIKEFSNILNQAKAKGKEILNKDMQVYISEQRNIIAKVKNSKLKLEGLEEILDVLNSFEDKKLLNYKNELNKIDSIINKLNTDYTSKAPSKEEDVSTTKSPIEVKR